MNNFTITCKKCGKKWNGFKEFYLDYRSKKVHYMRYPDSRIEDMFWIAHIEKCTGAEVFVIKKNIKKTAPKT